MRALVCAGQSWHGKRQTQDWIEAYKKESHGSCRATQRWKFCIHFIPGECAGHIQVKTTQEEPSLLEEPLQVTASKSTKHHGIQPATGQTIHQLTRGKWYA